MNNPKKRCRTGCLTCRSRKVKCDEGRPSCQRCLAANMECLGYDPKRPADAGRLLLRARSQQSAAETTFCREKKPRATSAFRPDGLPLVGFPVNPNPAQRPHLKARDVLGYNQYLARTVMVLFTDHDLPFWREHLCEEAFESECLFDAIVSLGTLHRAILLRSLESENDLHRGLDTQVVAVQTYIGAVQRLGNDLNEVETKLSTLTALLLLFSYFESFLGNIPATLRYVRAADYYFAQFLSTENSQTHLSVGPITRSLQGFARIYRLVLPLTDVANLRITTATHKNSCSTAEPTLSALLGSLLSLSSLDEYVESLIWSPCQIHSSPIAVDKVKAFQQVLQTWKNTNSNLLPFPESDTISSISDNLTWGAISELPIPPQPPDTSNSFTFCLCVALYNFFMARASWVLNIGAENAESNELLSFAYSYEAMRWSFPVCKSMQSLSDQSDMCLPCEAMTTGLVPMLYVIGHCCPLISWLQSIIEHLHRFGQVGLLNGKLLGRCLNTLYLFELHSGTDPSSLLIRFPPPAARILSVLIPDTDGGGFSAFYAKPSPSGCLLSPGLSRYRPVGQARWGNCRQDESAKPTNVEFLSDLNSRNLLFNEWLEARQPSKAWRDWLGTVHFDLELAIRDHIHSSRFVFDTNHVN